MTGTFELIDNKLILHTTVEKRMTKQQRNDKLVELEMATFELAQHRRLTLKQHSLIWALYGSLETYTGHTKEDWHQLLMGQFELMNDLQGLSTSFRSANAMTVQQANDYIEYILYYGLENSYPLYVLEGPEDNRIIKRTYEITKDIRRYQVKCLMKKICSVCGKVHDDNVKVGPHHVEHVGTEGYKNDCGQFKVIALCGLCHSKIHDIAGEEFEKYLQDHYHLGGVRLSEYELLIISAMGLYSGHWTKFRQTHKQQIAEIKEELERMGKL